MAPGQVWVVSRDAVAYARKHGIVEGEKDRYCVILNADDTLRDDAFPTVWAAWFTSHCELANQQDVVLRSEVTGLKEVSCLRLSQIQAVPKTCLIRYYSDLPEMARQMIRRQLLVILGLASK